MNASELREACFKKYENINYDGADREAIDAVIRTVLEVIDSEMQSDYLRQAEQFKETRDDKYKHRSACTFSWSYWVRRLLPSTDRADNG